MARRFKAKSKALELFARFKRGDKGALSFKTDKRGQFKKELKKGLKGALPSLKKVGFKGSYRDLDKSKLSADEKLKLILKASRKGK